MIYIRKKKQKTSFFSPKPLFGPKNATFWPKMGQMRFFWTLGTLSNFHTNYFLTSCKLDNFNDTISKKLQKNLFLGQKSAIMAKNRKIRFFPENRPQSLFKLNGCASSCKKSENSNEPFLRKAPDKRTHACKSREI